MNSFLFIIPATPKFALNPLRSRLQMLCLQSLISQKYTNWKVFWIDTDAPPAEHSNIIQIPISGKKEEKLQKLTQYIQDEKVNFDYIIRLDDDDIFNPNILGRLHNFKGDLYTDLMQYFWSPQSGQISGKVMYWFPNTCIHKWEHAFTVWGSFATGGPFEKYKKNPFLIENDHSKLHQFYKGKKVELADEKSPIYLRAINPSSSTAVQSSDYQKYLNGFGYWKKNNLKDFGFLGNEFEKNFIVSQSFMDKLVHYKNNLIAKKNYRKIVL